MCTNTNNTHCSPKAQPWTMATSIQTSHHDTEKIPEHNTLYTVLLTSGNKPPLFLIQLRATSKITTITAIYNLKTLYITANNEQF